MLDTEMSTDHISGHWPSGRVRGACFSGRRL